MAKTTKTTQTNKAAETRAAAEKALAEKRKAVRGTALYGKIKSAVDKAIEEAASEGASGITIPDTKIAGDRECISCGKCSDICPKRNISYAGHISDGNAPLAVLLRAGILFAVCVVFGLVRVL